ncbi:MAG TPA: HD domain-containing phosphohydrolase [Usitatibacter sp.]|nr:HD domain-containing phosphohydrolase [Usitatibacter sp.]
MKLNTLILEDNADDRFLLERALQKAGIAFDSTWVDCRQDFVRALESGRPDVILADCQLPDIDGAGALEIAMRMHPGAPVVMVTGGLSDEEAVKLLQAGAQDYVLKDRLARLGPAVVAAIERANAQARALEDAARLKGAFFSCIQAITRTMELRDPYTAGHQARVGVIASAIARELALEPERIEGVRVGAHMHDIGKISVPSEILTRPGKLTAAEYAIIKSHPEIGHDIVKDVDFPWPVARMIKEHHERVDGKGYPDGLAGDAILLEARVIAVADVYEAMTAHRPYRAALPIEVALDYLRNNRGTHFDPQPVDAMLELVRRCEV